MSRFNKVTTTKPIENRAGGQAFKQTDKLAFASILLTNFLKDQFYRSADETLKELKTRIAGLSDKKFAAKAAIYARQEFGMRSVSHAVAGEIAAVVKGEEWTKSFFDKVVRRPDDMTEIVSYYAGQYGKPLPNSMKKGLAKAFTKFDDYSLAKYRGEGKDVSLVDLVNLVHPKGDEKFSATIKKLLKGELVNTETWEAQLSAAGQVAENAEEVLKLKGKAWKALLSEDKLPYFALLRNLRNIIEQAPEVLDLALEKLVDRDAIKKSLVLPFRYTAAMREIEKLNGAESRKVLQALSKAVDISCDNIPKFPGRTLVVLDKSGSMEPSWSGKSEENSPAGIGSLFAALLAKSNNADFMMFADDTKMKSINPDDSTLSIAKAIRDDKFGGGTDFHIIFDRLKTKYDRIIILSDMQGWVGYHAPTKELEAYKKRTGADPKIYSFDLQGYGDMQFPADKVFCLAGFSDKIFGVMELLERDRNAMVHEIEKVEL